MLKNYFKIAWRNLIKDKQFTFLNLLGLSTGLACTLLIFLWVNDELSVDKYNEKDKRLYEVVKRIKDGEGVVQISKTTQGVLANTLADELPEIEYAVQVRRDDHQSIATLEDKHLKVTHAFAGKDFFDVFTYPLLNGSKNKLSGVKEIF